MGMGEKCFGICIFRGNPAVSNSLVTNRSVSFFAVIYS